MISGHGSLSEQDMVGNRDRRGSREESMRISGGGGGGGRSNEWEGTISGGYTEDGRGGRLEDDGRSVGLRGARGGDVGGSADPRRGNRMVERGGGGGMARGKRGRSVDSERGADASYDMEDEGDPSQAFDSKRMRQQDLSMAVEEGPARPSASRGYGTSDDVSGRWREDGGRRGSGGGGRAQMALRDQHVDRTPYDNRGLGSIGGGPRGGRQSMVHMDGGGGFMDQVYRDPRGSVLSDEDDIRGSKKVRHDRDRSSSSRARDDGDGGRKEKKKSSRKKSSKDKRKN